MMMLMRESDFLNQMSILLPTKMDEIKKHTSSYWEKRAEEERRQENRRADIFFGVVVALIVGFIGFSIWLSVEVGINKKNVWQGMLCIFTDL